jgi:tRNA-specific 2-thiouridylase
VHAKPDSTGICFIGERPFRQFLGRYLASDSGAILTADGVEVGRHIGLHHYTIGQRQGLGIGGLDGRSAQPWYVARKDMAHNRLIVVQGHDHPLLLATALTSVRHSWIAGQAPDARRTYGAKTRYRQVDAACRIVCLDAERCSIEFEQPQWAVTPGQSLVLYDGDHCVGGGIIESAHAATTTRTEVVARSQTVNAPTLP